MRRKTLTEFPHDSPWIHNVSHDDIVTGQHHDPGADGVLIQICDHDVPFPEPHYPFAHVHRFQFLDIEQDGMTNFGDGEMVDVSHLACSQRDADAIAQILTTALCNKQNVIVHCWAGVCRSGAVAQAAIDIGFHDVGAYRSPNKLVLRKVKAAIVEQAKISIPSPVTPSDYVDVYSVAEEARNRIKRKGQHD